MSKINNIKLFAGQKIVESDEFTNDSKVQLLKYIEEANVYEVMALLLDNKPQTISEQAAPIVASRFKKSELSENYSDFLLEGPLDFIKGLADKADSNNLITDFKGWSGEIFGKGKDMVDVAGKYWGDKFDSAKDAIGQVGADKVFSKTGDNVDTFLKKVGGVKDKTLVQKGVEKFNNLVDSLPDPIKNNPELSAGALALCLFSVLTFVFVAKKKGADKAEKEVKKKLEDRARKTKDSNQKKVAKSLADSF